jgi:hypothetical protein
LEHFRSSFYLGWSGVVGLEEGDPESVDQAALAKIRIV